MGEGKVGGSKDVGEIRVVWAIRRGSKEVERGGLYGAGERKEV